MNEPSLLTFGKQPTVNRNAHLTIGGFVFPGQDQIDFTGPFEVLSRIPNSTFVVLGKTLEPIRDVKGLLLTPMKTIAEAPQLDLLLVPGGLGQQQIMNDEEIIGLIQRQAASGTACFLRLHRCTLVWRSGFTLRTACHDSLGSERTVATIRRHPDRRPSRYRRQLCEISRRNRRIGWRPGDRGASERAGSGGGNSTRNRVCP